MITKEMLAETLLAFEHDTRFAHNAEADNCPECAMLKAAEECPEILRVIETAKITTVMTALMLGQSPSTEAMLVALKLGLVVGRRLGMSEAMEALT